MCYNNEESFLKYGAVGSVLWRTDALKSKAQKIIKKDFTEESKVNILVRNMSRGVTEEELFHLFQSFGEIKSLNVVIDASTGQSKGFGFVEMPDDSEAAAAIKALDGRIVQGMKIRVKKTARQNHSPSRYVPGRVRPERSEAGRKPSARRGTDGRARGAGHKRNTPKGRH